jgi:hypothetical protein
MEQDTYENIYEYLDDFKNRTLVYIKHCWQHFIEYSEYCFDNQNIL